MHIMASVVARLNWGCGTFAVPGLINSDRVGREGVDLPCDILTGLPLGTQSVDYAVAIHALQDLRWGQAVRPK